VPVLRRDCSSHHHHVTQGGHATDQRVPEAGQGCDLDPRPGTRLEPPDRRLPAVLTDAEDLFSGRHDPDAGFAAFGGRLEELP
jgi:hypothetical protein